MELHEVELLRKDLVREGLPATYADRLCRELVDHSQDVSSESSSSFDAKERFRIGDRACLAHQAVHEFRATRFAGRHPRIAFLLGPIPVAALLIGLYHLVLFQSVELILENTDDSYWHLNPNAFQHLKHFVYALFLVGKVLPIVCAAWLLRHWSETSGANDAWLSASLVVLCIFGGVAFATELELPNQIHGMATFATGGVWSVTAPQLHVQAIQAFSPFVAMWILDRRKHASQPYMSTT